MSDEAIPENPADFYKRLIDDCVHDSKDLLAEKLRKVDSTELDLVSDVGLLVHALTPEQRATLAGMLDSARVSAFHDFLATLTWWIDCHGLRLTYRGQPVPVDLSGMGLHGDYVGRLETVDPWQWPAKAPEPPPPWKPESA